MLTISITVTITIPITKTLLLLLPLSLLLLFTIAIALNPGSPGSASRWQCQDLASIGKWARYTTGGFHKP